jgi:hypothetical protein
MYPAKRVIERHAMPVFDTVHAAVGIIKGFEREKTVLPTPK